MDKTQYFQLKNYLKVVAQTIIPIKKNIKEIQSYCSLSEKLLEEANRLSSAAEFLSKRLPDQQKDLHRLQQLFRYLHIVYSIGRGRKYSQIESKVRPGNQIKFEEIKFYFKKAGVEIPENFKSEIENVPVKQPKKKVASVKKKPAFSSSTMLV